MASTTLSEQINALATRIGTECKTLQAHIGDLTGLSTSAKTSIVAAVNELKTLTGTLQTDINGHASRLTTVESKASANASTITSVQGSVSSLQTALEELERTVDGIEGTLESQTNINDSMASTSTTYSSSKIESVVTTAKQDVKNDLLGGAGAAYDTLKELADLIQTNKSAIDSLESIAAGHVRFDQAQSLSTEQKTQARTNIGAADASTVSSQGSTLATVQQTANQNKTDLANLKAAVGETSTDFVAAFESALEAS